MTSYALSLQSSKDRQLHRLLQMNNVEKDWIVLSFLENKNISDRGIKKQGISSMPKQVYDHQVQMTHFEQWWWLNLRPDVIHLDIYCVMELSVDG